MGFACIGLYLFYFAYRYNVLYVSNATIDTQGKAYTRALQHLTVGCYILIVCLIGLFAIASGSNQIAVGPLILMIIFLVFIVLYHISMNSAMDPLIHYLPKNIEAEEEALLAHDRKQLGETNGAEKENNGVSNVDSGVGNVDSAEKGLNGDSASAPPTGNFFMRWARPDKYYDYATLRRLVPNPLDIQSYPEAAERDAYCHPAVNSQPPLLWIPRDTLGISAQEVAHTSRVIQITDEDSWLDEKNKIQWNMEKGQPPIYEEKITY